VLSLFLGYAKNNNNTQNHFKNLGIKVFEEGFGEKLFSKSFSPQKTTTKVF